jgi:hypothetical protein
MQHSTHLIFDLGASSPSTSERCEVAQPGFGSTARCSPVVSWASGEGEVGAEFWALARDAAEAMERATDRMAARSEIDCDQSPAGAYRLDPGRGIDHSAIGDHLVPVGGK